MNISIKRLTGLLSVAALLAGLLLAGGAGDAKAQAMGGQGWTPSAKAAGANQAAGYGNGYGHGYGPGHNGAMRGYANTKNNTNAGYHGGHGPHAGPAQGCGW